MTGTLLWVSEPLTGNAREALVSGGSIVTGYGFTAEPDFVFVAAPPTVELPPAVDAETRCWVRRATAAILAGDAAAIHEASERLKPLSRDRILDDVLRNEEKQADARYYAVIAPSNGGRDWRSRCSIGSLPR